MNLFRVEIRARSRAVGGSLKIRCLGLSFLLDSSLRRRGVRSRSLADTAQLVSKAVFVNEEDQPLRIAYRPTALAPLRVSTSRWVSAPRGS